MNILTFDIEEWFHVLDVAATRGEAQWANFPSRIDAGVDRILELLARRRQRATFYCLGWVARTYPSVVRRIGDAGHEIASHSMYHQLAYELTPEEFRSDLRESIDAVQQAVGTKVRAYRVPGFSVTRANTWVFDCLREAGIECDSSVFPAPRGHGGFEGFGQAQPCLVQTMGGTLREFPINMASVFGKPLVFSGGGYFRLLPYWLIRRLMKRSPYVMTYFHPRDFDPGQPAIPGMPPHRRFKSYVGLAGALAKLERLLDEFPFVDLAAAEKAVDWSRAPVIKVG